MIEVVGAILVKHHRILLHQRPMLKDFDFCWESPGGKVDGSETHHQALRRELQEELGIDIGESCRCTRPVWSGRFDNKVSRPERADVVLSFYLIGDRYTGDPRRRESQPGLGWFLVDEMLCLNLSPANARAKHEIAAVMKDL